MRLFDLSIANKLVSERRRARWERNKRNFDESHRETKFSVGDEIFIRRPNRPKGVPGKFWVRNEGPYKVTKILGSGQTYEIDKRGSRETWHAEHLFAPSFPSQALERTSLIFSEGGEERESEGDEKREKEVEEMLKERE